MGRICDFYDDRCLESLSESLGKTVMAALFEKDVREIMLNCDGSLYIEYAGSGIRKAGFMLPEKAESVIRSVASLSGSELDLHAPVISAEFPFGSARFEGLLPPLVSSPVFSLRRHISSDKTLQMMYEEGTLTAANLELVLTALKERCSILIAGPTGSGKTTLLNALLLEITDHCPEERIITAEDTPEIHLSRGNRVHLCTGGRADMATLVRSALRLRPDRIVIGEVRGAEALYLVDAMCTGHSGGLASIHAGSEQEALHRMTLLVSRAPRVPRHIEDQVAEAIQLVIVLNRNPPCSIRSASLCTGFKNGVFITVPVRNAETLLYACKSRRRQ